MIKKYTFADPAPGADFTMTIPAGKYARVLALIGTLTTDATVINRTVKLTIDNGATIFFRGGNNGTGQAASNARPYSFMPGGTAEAALGINQQFGVYPIPDTVYGPGYRFISSTGSIQAADQWSGLAMIVDEEVSEVGLTRSR